MYKAIRATVPSSPGMSSVYELMKWMSLINAKQQPNIRQRDSIWEDLNGTCPNKRSRYMFGDLQGLQTNTLALDWIFLSESCICGIHFDHP